MAQRYDEIIVHYTATFEDDTSINVAVIDGWHKARGWAGIGYHFVIYQDGTLAFGRPLTKTGAHAPPNTGRIGICYVGGLRGTDTKNGHDTRTTAQIRTMTRLIRSLLDGDYNSNEKNAEVRVDPRATVKGHRDVGKTQCPGFDAGAWWRGVVTGSNPPSSMPAPGAPVRTENMGTDPLARPPSGGTSEASAWGAGAAAATGVALIVGQHLLWALAALVLVGALWVVVRIYNRRK